MAVIGIVACCDTKYHEIEFVRKKVQDSHNLPIVIDISTGKNIPIKADITREQVLLSGGYSWEQVKEFEKEQAISAMSKGAAKMVEHLFQKKKIDGIIGMGGLQNTVICSTAFRCLPIGFPKLICSTVASGYRYFDTVVGDKDITVMPSIVDFAGMNPISEAVLENAVGAVIGMIKMGGGKVDTKGQDYIGVTLMGVTNDTAMEACDLLEREGLKTISFHSTGTGGRVMEALIKEGILTGVMDLSLHEMTAEYFGGIGYSKGAEQRLCTAAKMGIPALVCPGAIDFACLRPDELFPDAEERGYVWHNHELTHTRLYEAEILKITETMIERLNQSTGPTKVVLPMRGLRTLSGPGEFFYKPDIIQKMKKLFETCLKPEVEFEAYDLNFCDPEFAHICASEFMRLMKNRK